MRVREERWSELIEYHGGKRYIRDTKMGRRLKVLERGTEEKKERKEKTGEKKDAVKPNDTRSPQIGKKKHKLPFVQWVQEIMQECQCDLHF